MWHKIWKQISFGLHLHKAFGWPQNAQGQKCQRWMTSSCLQRLPAIHGSAAAVKKRVSSKWWLFSHRWKGILSTDLMFLLTVNYYNVLHLESGKTNRLVVGSPGQTMHAMNEAQKQRRNRDTALVDMAKLCEAKVGLEDGWRVGHVVEICWNPYFFFQGGGLRVGWLEILWSLVFCVIVVPTCIGTNLANRDWSCNNGGKGNMSNDLMSRGYIMNSFGAFGFFIIWLLLLSTSLYGRQYYCMKTMCRTISKTA